MLRVGWNRIEIGLKSNGIKLKHCFLILIHLYSKPENPACQLMRLSDCIFCFDRFYFFTSIFCCWLSFVLFAPPFFGIVQLSHPILFFFFSSAPPLNRSQSVAVHILFTWIFRYFNISSFLHFGECIAVFYFCFLYFLGPVFFPCFFCLFVTSIL